ncbi:glutathione S-transferase family protein [Aestuariivirga litoralis]|uniref:Glutathione S-transferase family protein n=1 Tax=Aestuariivirga litoralis TaxID=2650924 RepID=A0A2W2BIB3_9HYPH|nr:glutathione S-transferase family protein [Aestuariivirga litoralis]PZF75919.1 glutathione S-transferase family protein [Aestuariivirga litoralis]
MLVDGKWSADWHPVQAKDQKGGFLRQDSQFRHVVTPDGDGGFRADAGRYHLYVALICPWASRTLVARKLKGLEDVISVSVVEPELDAQGWRFAEGADPINNARYMHEIYTAADGHYTGRATVPVLWDKQTGSIVNNESSDILRMFNMGFGALAGNTIDLYPEHLRNAIDALNGVIYAKLNNGVYRCGFATTQVAYEEAYHGVFEMLDQLEERLSSGPFLFGAELTEADIRLFVTLVRFDAAYHGLFKANKRRIVDYLNLNAYLHRLLQVDAFRDTVNISHIKRGYYSVKSLNPTGIVPLGPEGIALEGTGV